MTIYSRSLSNAVKQAVQHQLLITQAIKKAGLWELTTKEQTK